MRLVHAELIAVLGRNGVEAFDPSGEPFDPTVHEALSTRAAENGRVRASVLEVVEKGYSGERHRAAAGARGGAG